MKGITTGVWLALGINGRKGAYLSGIGQVGAGNLLRLGFWASLVLKNCNQAVEDFLQN
jgi:hypothetical protein